MKLEILNLSKNFGPKQVLRDVCFNAASGAALGLLGRNGAGKTTTIRIIMQVFPPDGGHVLLDGQPISHSAVQIGYLPEEKGLYPKVRIKDQLVYLGQLRGLTRQQALKSVRFWLERLELGEYLDKKLETLSKGNQQKIQLAVAMLADPDIIILDEPFSGLDPVNAQLMKEIVTEQVGQGKVVLFSSHQMNYVEQFCDQVAILDQGQIVLQGSIREIKRSFNRDKLLVSLDSDPDTAGDRLSRLLAESPELQALIVQMQPSPDGCIIRLRDPEDRRVLFQALADRQADISRFTVIEPSLEEIFVAKVGDRLENEA